MDRKDIPPLQLHYHIRWGSGLLDWARFDASEQAGACAQELLRANETYSIEEFGESCPRCMKAATCLEYPWQRLVFEACKAPAANLSLKISIAERAISERLRGRTLSTGEHVKLQEALNVLDVLLPKKARPSAKEKMA